MIYSFSHDGNIKPELTNVTFSGNSAEYKGGALFNRGHENGTVAPELRNSIVWNNQDYGGKGKITSNIFNKNATVILEHSLLQNSFPNGSWAGGSYINGGGNIDTNPMFIEPNDPSEAPATEGNYRLQPGSPAINAGNNAFVTEPKDLGGNGRILAGTVDMGAYELMPISFMPLIIR